MAHVVIRQWTLRLLLLLAIVKNIAVIMNVQISVYVPVFCSLGIYSEVKLLSQLVILCLILEGTITLFSIAVVPYTFILKYSEKLNLPSQGWKGSKLPRFLIFHPRSTYKLKIITAYTHTVCVCVCVSVSLFLTPWPEIRPRGPPFSLSLLPSSSLTFRPFQGPFCFRTDPCAPLLMAQSVTSPRRFLLIPTSLLIRPSCPRHFPVLWWASGSRPCPGCPAADQSLFSESLRHAGVSGASQVALVVKNPPANAGGIRDLGLIPGSGRSPGGGHGNPLQYSCLENLMDREAWQATAYRVAKSDMNKATHTHTHIHTRARAQWPLGSPAPPSGGRESPESQGSGGSGLEPSSLVSQPVPSSFTCGHYFSTGPRLWPTTPHCPLPSPSPWMPSEPSLSPQFWPISLGTEIL